MPLVNIPANRNVGACVGDINANFKYLDRESKDKSGEYTQDT